MTNGTSPKKRIAFFLAGLGRTRRGTEIFYEALLLRLAHDRSLEITVFAGGKNLGIPGVRWVRVPTAPREWFLRMPYIRKLRLTHPWDWEELSFGAALFPLLAWRSFDVLVTGAFPYTYLALRAYHAVHPQAKLLFTSQGGTSFSHSRLFTWCDLLTAINPEYHVEFSRNFRSELLPQSVDTDFFQEVPASRSALGIPEDVFVVLSASALESIKRVDALIEAVAGMSDAHLVIAGTGSKEAELVALAKTRLGERAIFLGSVDATVLRACYNTSDVFVLPSLSEAFGNVLIEAMACETPVVSHDDATRRWVVGDGGILADLSAPKGIRTVLETLRADAKFRGELGQKGRAYAVKNFSADAVAMQFSALINALVA